MWKVNEFVNTFSGTSSPWLSWKRTIKWFLLSVYTCMHTLDILLSLDHYSATTVVGNKINSLQLSLPTCSSRSLVIIDITCWSWRMSKLLI